MPRLVVSIKVAYDQRITSKVPPKERGETRSEAAGARGRGGDVKVDDGDINLVYVDDDTLMLSGIIVSEEEVSTERFVGGVLPDKEG